MHLKKNGALAKPFLSSPPAMINLILHSLAARYKTILHQIETLTSRHFRRLYIVGGGNRNRLLNHITQQATGLKLVCGAQESSTLGNVSIQLAALDRLHLSPVGEYRGDVEQHGVDHEAVSRWAGVLADAQVQAQSTKTIQSSPV
jgi:rhamnulokinase